MKNIHVLPTDKKKFTIMDPRIPRFTDNYNLRCINEGFMSELLRHKQVCSPNILTTRENIVDIIDSLSKKSTNFIIESVNYNKMSVKLEITSVYMDFGMYNFTKSISYSKIK
jgi:hypothetical protein